MSVEKSAEIICTACGNESLVVKKPKYDGFERVGDTFTCASCGHEYDAEEDVPFKNIQRAQVFTDADRSDDVEVFEEDEADRLCRYCKHYVVNPFLQRCGLHKKEVEATDTCAQFKRKEEEEEGNPSPI